jgi:hypothetical protein
MFLTPTSAEKSLIKQLLKKQRHPAPFLRNCGMSFLLKDEPTQAQLLKMSRKEQAQYADFVMQAVAGDEELEKQCMGGSFPSPRGTLNTTAIGGIAYLALHGVESRRKDCLAFLEAYQKHHEK